MGLVWVWCESGVGVLCGMSQFIILYIHNNIANSQYSRDNESLISEAI